jgi:hypothetical protein
MLKTQSNFLINKYSILFKKEINKSSKDEIISVFVGTFYKTYWFKATLLNSSDKLKTNQVYWLNKVVNIMYFTNKLSISNYLMYIKSNSIIKYYQNLCIFGFSVKSSYFINLYKYWFNRYFIYFKLLMNYKKIKAKLLNY